MRQMITEGVAAALLEGSPDGVVICNDGGEIVLVNRQIEKLFEVERDQLVGQRIECLIPEHQRSTHVDHRRRYTADPRTRPMGQGVQLWARKWDDTVFPVEIALSPIPTPAGVLVIATVRDVTARLAAQAELEEARTRTMLAEDRERIARDLHDTVIQRLFADGLTLQAMLPRVPEELRGRLQDVLDDHDDAIREIRTSIFGLGRSRAAESGLRRAVLDVVEQAARVLGFRPTLRLDGVLEGRMSGPVESELLATMREALSNAARHACAGAIEVDVAANDSYLTLVVADNGSGIAPERLGSGNGLANMQARATELGGRCEIGPRPGGGTIVEWRVPIS